MKDRIRLGNKKDKVINPIIVGDTFEEWKTTVNAQGLFADIKNNNETTGDDVGTVEIGTAFNKANTLPDTLEEKLGLTMEDPTIADAVNILSDNSINIYSCTTTGTTHALVGEGYNGKFIADAPFVSGDIITINGVEQAIKIQGNPDPPDDDFWLEGDLVVFFLDWNEE